MGHDPSAEWMGIEVEHAENGHAIMHMTVREEMLNGYGIAQGGMIFAFADTCFAWICNDMDGDGSTITVAQGVDVNFISSPKVGQRLTASGRLLSQFGRSGLYDIEVTDDAGRLVAQFRGRSRTIPNRS
ncbi:hotdog fold thioesterase [Micrococcus terreus]|uniref:hotdog fold thioesterase n=1 Tax=Micrococcus terreus TaxID=574650 RepID=UPI0033C5E88E